MSAPIRIADLRRRAEPRVRLTLYCSEILALLDVAQAAQRYAIAVPGSEATPPVRLTSDEIQRRGMERVNAGAELREALARFEWGA